MTGYEYPAPPAPGYRYGERDRWGSDTDWGNDWFGDWGSLFDGTGHIDMDFELDMKMDMEARGDADADTDTGFRGDSYYRGYEGYGPWPYGPPPGLYPPPPAPMPMPVPAAQAPSAPDAASADEDNDGVLNNGDFCPNTAEGTSVDAFGCAINEAIVLHGVHFHTDSDRLTDESITILDGVAETLLAYPDMKLEVSGHTDSDAEDAYNKDLSQRRADRVRQYLVDKGVKSENLTAKGYGEERPVANNDTAEGKALNRRVELNRL
jgi:outer membrane protein OmpA-like peptidoglycan-associated protein